MKRTYTEIQEREYLPFAEYLEELRKQGAKDAPKALFYVFLGFVAVCGIFAVYFIYSVGLEAIRAYFSENWILPLLLLSVFNGWAAINLVKVSLMLWRFTREEDTNNL